jgi:sialate O-acetylesterase
LAWLALANDYGVKGLPITPVYKSMKVEGESIRVSFSGTSSVGNCFRINGPQYKLKLVGFEIAGADRVWYNADAEIDSKTNDILVSSPKVPNPVAVRYAFRNWPEGANVVTDYDMPLPPFRTDDWPIEKD